MGKIIATERVSAPDKVSVPPVDALQPSTAFIQSSHGVWLKKNWMDATFNFCYRGSYSPLLTDYLSSQIRQFAFVDIGANQGLYSLIAAQSEYCVQVLAFEPVCKTFALLEQNIQANPHAEKISAFRLAVSDREGSQAISLKIGHSGAATLRPTHSPLFHRAETVHTAGAKIVAELKPDLAEIIKIDVEGHEEVVLTTLGEAAYLDTARAIFYEVDARWSNADRLKQILLGYGFTSFLQSSAGKHYDVLATRV